MRHGGILPERLAAEVPDEGTAARDIERVLDRLVDEGFINEARFVRAYVHDKALYDRWGQLKSGSR